MIITEVWDDPPPPPTMPSVLTLVEQLADPNPEIACMAIRDLRRILRIFEDVRIHQLMAIPSMTYVRAGAATGYSYCTIRDRIGRGRPRPRA